MASINQNVEIYAGDDVEISIALKQANGTTALDLSGATINWAMSSIYDIGRALVTKSSAVPGEITITDAAAGLVSIFLTPADTEDLGGQPYHHEAEVDSGGTTVTVLTGSVTINKTTLH